LPRLKRKPNLLSATPLIKRLRRNWVIVNRVGLGGIARREGPVATIEAVAQAARVAKDVRIEGPEVVVKVEDVPKDATKADPAVAEAVHLKGSPKSN